MATEVFKLFIKIEKRYIRVDRTYNTLHKYQSKVIDFDRSACMEAICYSFPM